MREKRFGLDLEGSEEIIYIYGRILIEYFSLTWDADRASV